LVVSANEGSYEARRSALPDRIEVRVRSERRRRWSDADKLAIVRETLAPGAVAQVVADRHGIGTGLLYTWRKQMLRAAMTGFAAVEIRPEAQPAPQVTDDRAPLVVEMPPKPPSLPSLIEVELPTGVRLRVGPDVDGPALRRVLAALAGP
jgi:transposase